MHLTTVEGHQKKGWPPNPWSAVADIRKEEQERGRTVGMHHIEIKLSFSHSVTFWNVAGWRDSLDHVYRVAYMYSPSLVTFPPPPLQETNEILTLIIFKVRCCFPCHSCQWTTLFEGESHHLSRQSKKGRGKRRYRGKAEGKTWQKAILSQRCRSAMLGDPQRTTSSCQNSRSQTSSRVDQLDGFSSSWRRSEGVWEHQRSHPLFRIAEESRIHFWSFFDCPLFSMEEHQSFQKR